MHLLCTRASIGSNRGWKEAPYVPCPAGIDDLVKALVPVGEREMIVPGVSYIGNGRADNNDSAGFSGGGSYAMPTAERRA